MAKAIVEATPLRNAKKKKVREFRMLPNVGDHFEPNPDYDAEFPEDEDNPRDTHYVAGDIVKSTRELDKIFANKFTRQVNEDDEPELVTAPGTTIPQDPENDPFRDVPVESTEAANKKTADRFLSEEELEGKPELQKLARGVKAKNPLDDDEDEEADDEEESAEEEDVEETPKKKSRGAKKSKKSK